MIFLLPGIALLYAIGSYGLMRRTLWSWYLGLVYLHLMTGWLFYGMLFLAWDTGTQAAVLYACARIIGITCLWLCALLWWLKRKDEFRSRY